MKNKCPLPVNIRTEHAFKEKKSSKLLILLPKETKRCEDHRLVVTASFAFCDITQNDRLNLSFEKDIYIDCEKLARNGQKTTIYIL